MSQGRIARANYIDSSLSSSRMVSFRLSGSLIKFVLKARLQLLECNRFLHTYYPGNRQRDARGAVFTLTLLATHSTVAGREKIRFKSFSTLASVVVENVRGLFSRAMILEDQIVQLSYFENNSQPAQKPTVFQHTRPDLCVIDHKHTRPDLCVIDHEHTLPDLRVTDHGTKTCLTVEVSVPLDVSRPDLCAIDHATKTCLSVEVPIPLDVFRPDLCVIDQSCEQNVFDC